MYISGLFLKLKALDWNIFWGIAKFQIVFGVANKHRIKCLAKGHSAVPLVKLEHAIPHSRVKQPITERLHSFTTFVVTGALRVI